ncbi:ATP-binding protein [Neptuniibacter halophilus]|uniref:ATP-binding protein n=1 Tax=Neptuniibacter halophilus TaxID=651666 RepID=UPI002573B5E6|nr:ATP-binding protein [Neptuniibacter halophilus]
MPARGNIDRISFWKNSLIRRYFLFSLLIATLPLLVITWSYDRFTGQLLDSIEEQKAGYSINTSYLSVMGFLRNRQYELSSVIDLPGVDGLLAGDAGRPLPDSVYNLINFETDSPHIYGVLLFDRNWTLQHALPGQGAAGYPYWGEGEFDISLLPQVKLGDFLLIGPQLPSRGESGWFLLAHPINSSSLNQASPGYAALQIRLASITELLKPFGQIQTIKPYLLTPYGDAFNLLGEAVEVNDEALVSESVAPGWKIIGIKTGDLGDFTKDLSRSLIIAGTVPSILLVIFFFVNFAYRVKKRILPLIDGADMIAKGDLTHRITPTGHDEITLLAKTFNSMGRQLQDLIDSRISMEKKAVMGEFSAGIAHEIRNPLATMKVCVQSLSAGEHDPRAQEQLDMMLEEIDRINEVIEDLLDYARPMTPRLERVELAPLLSRIESLVGPLATRSDVELTLKSDPDAVILADSNQVLQVMMNLALNAIQAMPDGGRLLLRSYSQGECIYIVIEDSGLGMRPEQIEKATQPFFTTKSEGTGLGLAICARLMHLNQGFLSIKSILGKGTTVTLEFKPARSTDE